MFKRPIRFVLFFIFFTSGLLGLGNFFRFVNSAQAAANLNGRILLQVQDKGQAWYVNPLNTQRYYLGRPDDAFEIMRSLGLGISNQDLNIFLNKAPARLSGRILLKVQDKGQAYYVDPITLKLFYLGRPADAYAVMRLKGLGISNQDLATIRAAVPFLGEIIPTGNTNAITPLGRNFSFKYQNRNYELLQAFSTTLYNSYKNSPKVYSYPEGSELTNLREVFYALFLNIKTNDKSLDEIISKLKKQAVDNNWTEDQLLEFTLAFIQYIPYDESKVAISGTANNNPYFPYETLYLDKGVCSDKTFLGVALLRKLGYGAAILDFPDKNHTALGIACPKEYSINKSGYCYGETTNYFPLGVVPKSIAAGQAQTADGVVDLFDASSLGKIEIYQQTTGKIYQGVAGLKLRAEALSSLKNELNTSQGEVSTMTSALSFKEASVSELKRQMDVYYSSGQLGEYNKLVSDYNAQVSQYNSDLSVYKAKVSEYNSKVAEYNAALKLFYQQ